MNSPLRSWSPKSSDDSSGGTYHYYPEIWKLLKSKMGELKQERLNMLSLLQQKRKEISSLRSELDVVYEGQNSHEKEIQTLQRAAFRKMAEAAWVPQEETVVQEELRDCNQKIWTWAKSHAIKSFDDGGNEARRHLSECLSHTVQLKDGEFPEYFGEGKLATQVPALLVASTISEEIYHRTIGEPFLVFYTPFEDRKQPKSERSHSIMNCLGDVYSQLNKQNMSGANLWRAQLYRILFPRLPDMMDLDQPPCDEYIDKSLENTIKSIVNLVIESKPLNYLLKETDDQGKARRDELEKIVRQVVFLCTRLGTQRTKFALEPSSRLLEDEFKVDSDIMEAHRLHKLGYDDTRLDGSKVGIVVHPAICAWGDNDGENYGFSRVLSRAVVWLEEH